MTDNDTIDDDLADDEFPAEEADEVDEQADQEWYDAKSALMVEMLGPEHDMVMHAIIPYAIGGTLDLYYYPHGRPGTAIATKELCETRGDGSSNEFFDDYELVMFTRQPIDLDAAKDETSEFGRMHQTINAILNCIAPYSVDATLNPGETCEFPAEMDEIGGKCLIFDGMIPGDEDEFDGFGLLVIIEVFRSEMEFARANSGAQLLDRLEAAGHYPYSDLNREPVA